MSAAYALDHRRLVDDPRWTDRGRELSAWSSIDSRESFNHYCREAIRLGPAPVGQVASAQFDQLSSRIREGGAGVISTAWGGVVVTLHQHPKVEKYLVIRRGGYLALETHEQKDEHLEVQEGAGLILWRSAADQPLTVEALAPGAKFHFAPGMEHCLIGTEDLLVFERSTDPKGMDQDLIFIYEPDRLPT